MTHHGNFIIQFLSLPKLKIERVYRNYQSRFLILEARSLSVDAVHPKCGSLCTRTYDTRVCHVKDSPIRDHKVTLRLHKKRYYCKACKRPFTEAMEGIYSRSRVTSRLRRHILYLGKKFRTLQDVAKDVGLALTTIQRHFYSALRVEQGRHLNYEWPKDIGIDEKRFGKRKNGYGAHFHTVIVDHVHDRIYDLLFTKNSKILFEQLKDSPGRENVENVTMDLSEGFRSLAKALFPNARITADRFHVERQLLPAINRRRKLLAGDRRKNPIGSLLLRSRKELDFSTRSIVHRWLEPHEELQIIYSFKERIKGFYRIKGYHRACIALDNILKDLKQFEHIPELRTHRWTLSRWKNEILNFFQTGLTNARVEGFNNKINVLKTNGYGYICESNYRLRVLSACF